jgi:putative ABC transport system permease protein
MHPLDLKLLRDLGKMKGQMLAVALVMACGLAVMVMARSLVVSLDGARSSYYARHHFAEVFCDLKRAPNSLRKQLEQIPGIAAVDTRVRGSLILDLPGMKEPADGLIFSLPDDRPQQLNLLYVRKGRLPKPGDHYEVAVSEAFAKAHGFEPGDTVEATLYGARERLQITGIVLSPEFVFEARPGQPAPDNLRFGVFWMNERKLSTALDLDGAFNSVAADVAPGADPQAVMGELDRLLEPYGGQIAYDREDHASAKQIADDIRVLSAFAVAFPILFLSVSAFMTSAALTRLIRLQREQIAQLKAFGYSSWAVGGHYLKFALVIVLAGSLIGALLGLWMGNGITGIYQRFFLFPKLEFQPDVRGLSVGFLGAAAVSFLGVAGAVWQAVKLPPAEAMRPEPPSEFKPSAFERLGLQNLVSPAFRMALRNLERKPWQAFFTTFGLSLATAIPIIPGTMRDGITYLLDFQWTQAQRQDATVSFIEPGSATALSAVHHLPGVLRAEPFRGVSARLSHGHIERRVAVTGRPLDAQLNRVLDARGLPVAMPLDGLLLSAKLAELLGVKPGDSVRIEVQEGRRPVLEAVVAGTITDFAGLGAYMDLEALRRLMREGGTLSGAHVTVDRTRWDEFLAEVKEAPRIGSLAISGTARESFKETTGEMMGVVQGVYFGFAIIVAFGVVYNGARIALSERGRDLATLRVIGFSPREVASVLISELALLTLLALPFGLYFGSQLARLMVETASTETVRLPLLHTPRTYATAVLVILLSSGLSFAIVSRRIRHLDLLSVLNARD